MAPVLPGRFSTVTEVTSAVPYRCVQLAGGALGGGIANSSCTLSSRWLSGSPALNYTDIATTNSSASSASFTGATRGTLGVPLLPCPSPLVFSLAEGLYVFNFYATSNAGLKAQASQALMVDASPPVSQIVTQPSTSSYPSQVEGCPPAFI